MMLADKPVKHIKMQQRSVTFRLLRACASFGMVKYDGKSRFAGAQLLDTLWKDNPKNLRAAHWRGPRRRTVCQLGRFVQAVKTGLSQTIPSLGMGPTPDECARPIEIDVSCFDSR
jgi:hypothetical protein